MHTRTQEGGFVSIFSVLIIMAILTLIAVGFSNVTRRAQRRTLDNQLNTQAFYAAESGVNDAKRVLARVLATNPTYTKPNCRDSTDPPEFTYNLDPELGIGYTCVLVNTQLQDIKLDTVPIEGSSANPKVVALESVGGANIKSFQVTWDREGTASGATVPGTFGPNGLTTSGAWGADTLGMVRIDLAPTAGGLGRSNLATGAYTFFLYPTTNAGGVTTANVNPGSAEQGPIIYVRCPTNVTSALSPCKATINLNGPGSSKYVMRVLALYNSVKVYVINVRDQVNGLGNKLTLQNGQTIVDVTGKAADVLRRIQVRLPVAINGLMPAFAVQSADSICKRLFVGPVTSVDTSVSDPACALDTGGGGGLVGDPDIERFPGDPNPLITHKSYWGASITGNGDPARHESKTGGKSLSSHRTYWQWDDAKNAGSGMYRTIRDDINNNRLPFISIKSPITSGSAWQKMANGNYDTDIDNILTRLNSYGKPVWVVFHHEPEGGDGPGADDPGGADAWKDMQSHIRDRMNFLRIGPDDNIAFMPIMMVYSWNLGSGINPDNWFVPNIWNAFIVDTFQNDEAGDMFTGQWNTFVSWAERKGMPFGTGEWGNEGTDVQAAADMQAFWDWGVNTPGHDVVVYSYYDSNLNGGKELTGQPLVKFRDILRSDTRVQRIDD